jgi:hypothetical protein
MKPTPVDTLHAEQQVRENIGKITKLLFEEDLVEPNWEWFKSTPMGSMLIAERAKYIALEREYDEFLHRVRQLLIDLNKGKSLCFWCLSEATTEEEARRHAFECEKSPLNEARRSLEKKVSELTEKIITLNKNGQ